MTNAKWINATIIAGSVMFVFGLTVSAIFAPQWRVLHIFQALIYVPIVALTRRRSAWGYGAGVLMATFWNGALLFRSPFGQELLRGVVRPDIVIQCIALCGHFLIIVACLAGFLRTRPVGRQWAAFAAGGVIAIGYLLVMVFTVGPPEGIEHIKHVFGLS